MGNALGCAGLGERLAAAARDGDGAEVRRLLEANPGLARCAAFGSLNSPLHLAAAKGHHEIAALLLENGADVNARNIYGQTALMQACRFGHWEVVQTLLVFRCNVSKADSLSSRTALHAAAAGGHVKCARLLLAAAAAAGGGRFVNRAASGGVTALHLAALHGHVDCVHLLIDEHADLAAQTLPCVAAPMGSIGAGSTPLHYAAAGGEVKCCQILVSRGADRTAVNCNGWLPVDVARTWGCHWLEHVLSPKSHLPIPKFPPSGYLSSPLPSVLTLARDCGLVLNTSSEFSDGGVDESDACAVCLERPCNVAAEGLPVHSYKHMNLSQGEKNQFLQMLILFMLDSVWARAVREVRAGPVLGDQVLRRAGDRRQHPVPALPERHRLVQEAGGLGSGGRGARA
uniref:Uncharacterized protein n=1 Tax=Setaria italica TaxID=4555 RepID=K3XXD7_SETIT